jgi:predicted MFS family arabinose efflux permease
VREVLKLGAFRRLLVAYALNELAWSFGTLALAILVYRRTGSAIGAMAYFLAAQFVPALIAPAVVARVDQLPPNSVLPALYALEAMMFAALAVVASPFLIVPVLALTIIDGVLATMARPIARAATVAVTAPVGLLREGNALTNAAFSICYMLGPALGGAIVVAGGTVAALLANSGVFAVIALTLLGLRDLGHGPARTPTAGRLRAAFAYARAQPPIRVLLSLQGLAVVFFTVAVPVEVVFAEHSLRAGAAGYGALLSAWGAGAVLGSAVYARWRHLASRTLIAGSAASLGVGFAVMAASPGLPLAIAGAAFAGIGNGVEAVAARTALQEHVAERWMPMIMSLSDSVQQAAPGAGMLIGGAMAWLAGPRPALAVAGGGALMIAAVARLLLGAEDARRGAPIGGSI